MASRGVPDDPMDERIEAAIKRAGVIPEFCQWSGNDPVRIEVGEVPPYVPVHVGRDWTVERIADELTAVCDER